MRTGLEELIATFDDVEVVGSGVNGQEAVDVCTAALPDVALIDLEMPVLDGIEATQRILSASPATSGIVFTSFSDRERTLRALDAGADRISPQGRRT